jgi:tRNA (guanine9-N1)-methyltransferase
MTDIEERPSKIRKLNAAESTNGVQHNDTTAPSEPLPDANTNNMDQPQVAPLDEATEDVHSEAPNETDGQKAQDASLPQGLSKSQLKKLKKKQQWEEGRENRKVKRKEKTKERRIRKAVEKEEAAKQAAEQAAENPAEASAEAPAGSTQPAPPSKGRMRPVTTPITFILDCDFNDLMHDSELTSLSSQLTRCYSDNKTAPFRAHMVVSSFGGKLKERFDGILAKNYQSWKGVTFTDGDFVAAAAEADTRMRGKEGGRLVGALAGGEGASSVTSDSKENGEKPGKKQKRKRGEKSMEEIAEPAEAPNGTIEPSLEAQESPATEAVPSKPVEDGPKETEAPQEEPDVSTPGGTEPSAIAPAGPDAPQVSPPTPNIVYLSSDSPNTLSVLSPYTSYIIGGIVDKNRHKGLCYKRACERGIPTAKLPIGEYMTMQSRTVLATNHVYEIMLRWLETGDWGEAFLKVIPKRKEAKLKKGAAPSSCDDVEEGREDGATPAPEGDAVKAQESEKDDEDLIEL